METNDPLPRIAYSARETANLIGVKYQTVLAEIRAGRLVARRVGKEYRVHRHMIDEYLKCPGQESQPVSEWTVRQAIGASSDQMAVAVDSDFEARLLAKLRKKNSPTS